MKVLVSGLGTYANNQSAKGVKNRVGGVYRFPSKVAAKRRSRPRSRNVCVSEPEVGGCAQLACIGSLLRSERE